jgi:hypothetical protein
MAGFKLPQKKRYAQPQGKPVIASRWARGLLTHQTGVDKGDYVNNGATIPAFVQTPSGVARNYLGTTAITRSIPSQTNSDYTFVVRVRYKSGSQAGWIGAGAGSGGAYLLYRNSSTQLVMFHNGYAVIGTDPYTSQVNKECTIVGRVSASRGSMDVWCDGQKLATSSAGAATAINTAIVGGYYLNGSILLQTGDDVIASLTYSRWLDDAEVVALSENIWQAYAATPYTFGLGAAASAITGTASTSQAQSINVVGAFSPPVISGVATTSQAQALAGSGTFTPGAVTGACTTSQAQTTSASGTVTSPVTGTATTSQAQTSSGLGAVGGGEAGYSQEYKVKKWYVRRGKKIHVFESAEDADNWLDAEERANQAIEQARKSSGLTRTKKQRVYKALDDVYEHEVIKLDSLAENVGKLGVDFDLQSLIRAEDWSEIARIALIVQNAQNERIMQLELERQMAQDDEDIELLLLA